MALRSVRGCAKPVRDCCHDLDRDVLSYLVLGLGDIVVGRIDDIITDTRRYISRYMVVDTRFASFVVAAKRILIPVTEANVDHQRRVVRVGLTAELVAGARELSGTTKVARETEELIHTYFGFAPYWTLQDDEDGFGFSRHQVTTNDAVASAGRAASTR